jgi:hypothetical protein
MIKVPTKNVRADSRVVAGSGAFSNSRSDPLDWSEALSSLERSSIATMLPNQQSALPHVHFVSLIQGGAAHLVNDGNIRLAFFDESLHDIERTNTARVNDCSGIVVVNSIDISTTLEQMLDRKSLVVSGCEHERGDLILLRVRIDICLTKIKKKKEKISNESQLEQGRCERTCPGERR